MSRTAEPEQTLSLLCWAGYDDAALLAPFERRHHARVRAKTLVSDHEAVATILAEPNYWDVVNLNNPFPREVLDRRHLLRTLDRVQLEPLFARSLPRLRRLWRAALSTDGTRLIGVCQRFGPFNLVVNSDRIAPRFAEDQGFNLPEDMRLAGRYGILAYDDFNVFHIAIAAGLDPFGSIDDAALARFTAKARLWHSRAKLVTSDHHTLNRALAAGEIDFYLSGGIYTASSARLAGGRNIVAVTPTHGPIAGKGAIAFAEVTSVLDKSAGAALGELFLAYLMEPETAVRAALAGGSCNPVAQMGDPKVRLAFTREQLDAMQWAGLEEGLERCADYALGPDYQRLHGALVAVRGEGQNSLR
jgi:spermidine/putrescine transport system substrate-binding protein